MRIAVCVARVVDPEEALDLRGGLTRLEAGDLRHALNEADACALEQALELRDRRRNAEIHVLSMGPPGCISVLRDALALGADEARLLWDARFEHSDTLATARILAAAIRRAGADLVLCGDRATDGSTGQVGVQLAELLGMPAITGTLGIEILESGELRAQRGLERGRRCDVRCAPPALFTLSPGAGRRRYPRLRDRLRAEDAAIPTWDLEALALQAADVGAIGSLARVVALSRPKPSTKGMFVPDAGLSPEERWEQIVSGGAPPSPGPSAPPSAAVTDPVQQILDFLEEGRYI